MVATAVFLWDPDSATEFSGGDPKPVGDLKSCILETSNVVTVSSSLHCEKFVRCFLPKKFILEAMTPIAENFFAEATGSGRGFSANEPS